ncbi:phosphocarrier protein Chr [Kurthia sp. 3B1D]|uniref:Phosphocarrier protein Chr n=2 Tax=Kurthia TaxID=1649 RepID=A0A433RS05_9BACL|nr:MULTISPECIES: HPr family phosphocarrier protein [unclassified Kurthia]RUS53838.1 phosphocarrier protein Chr [Kurthia sp. 3B1D]HIX42744.1 HPr family phosphocarrier protein [Candidatus Kurthia intestinigallinarum]
MIQQQLTVELEAGLQARQAASFVQEANSFMSDIFIEKETKHINAKSIMGVMSLAISSGESITLTTDGEDEQQAIEKLSKFLTSK